nr:ribonuclease H-like domain-containing protein [Tanacetum cinerariifolium]
MHVVVWRNKLDLDSMSMDDLYNNLNVYELEVKGVSNSSTNTHNMAFVSSSLNNTNNSNEGVNTAFRVSTVGTHVNVTCSTNIDNLSDAVICAFLVSQPNGSQLVNEDLEQIHLDDLEEMDLKWQMTMLIMRSRRFLKNTGRKLNLNGNETVAFEKIKSTRTNIPVESTSSSALVSCDGHGGYYWSDQAKEGPNYALMAYSTSSSDSKVSTDSKFCLETVKILKAQNEQLLKDLKKSELNVIAYKEAITELRRKLEVAQKEKDSTQLNVVKLENASKSLNKIIECQIVDNFKNGFGYNAVPLPIQDSKAKVSKVEPEIVKKNNEEPIIEDWESDNEEEFMTQPKEEKKTYKPSVAKIEFVKSSQQVKNARETVKQVERNRQNTTRRKGNQRNWNNQMSQKLGENFEMFNKACYVCGCFEHLQYNCQHHQNKFKNKKVVKPVWNYNQRVNHKFFAKKTHPSDKKNMVPKAVLINAARQNLSKIVVTINTARPINTANLKRIMNAANKMSYFSNGTHSSFNRPIQKTTAFKNSYANKWVNTIKGKTVNVARQTVAVNAARPKVAVNDVKGNDIHVVKALAR